MKTLLIITLALLPISQAVAVCLNATERNNVQAYVDSNLAHNKKYDMEYNPYVPYFKCKIPKTDLERYVCSNKDIALMFHAEAFAYNYALANAFKHEFSYRELSVKEAKFWNDRYNAANMSELCSKLKESSESHLGGLNPYTPVE